MNKKLLAIILVLILGVTVSLVYAQENGYFLDITNSNSNLNTSITNSTVVENITLSNGTLNMQINADNISSVTINGVNYTAQQTPTSPPSSSTPQVLITYYGMNVGASGVLEFAKMLPTGSSANQTGQAICYTWNITLLNMKVNQPPGGPEVNHALAPLATQYPQLITQNRPNPELGNTTELSPMHCCGAFGGNYNKCCFGLYANNPLSNDQINQLTQDLAAQLTNVLINWYT